MICRSARSLRPVQGCSSRPRAAGVIRPASSSPSRSRNSQRYRSPVTCMKVAARAGSQICSTPSQVSRPLLARMSTTSQRSVKPRSSMVIPASSRIVLLAPSQPSTTGPVNVCVSPATRACTRTGAVYSGHLGPAAEVDQRMPLDPGEQQFFEVGLVEHVRLGEAVLAWLVVAAELGHDAVPGVEQAQPAAGPGPGQESLADADPVQGPGDLVVQVHRAGQGVGLGVAFQQGDRDPGIGEQEGDGAAGRACANGDDGFLGGEVLVVHGRVLFSAGQFAAAWAAGDGPVRMVRANPATASRTRPGSAPVTVRISRPSSCAAEVLASGRPAAASASVTTRTAASAASAGLKCLPTAVTGIASTG